MNRKCVIACCNTSPAIFLVQVPDSNFKDVRPYLELPHFNAETIRSKNSVAAGLCSWVVNIVTYRDIVITVEPKKIKLREVC